jgi:hypothetical protein
VAACVCGVVFEVFYSLCESEFLDNIAKPSEDVHPNFGIEVHNVGI